MVEELIQRIYDKTIAVVKNNLCKSKIDCEERYLNYLEEKYSVLLTAFVSEESDSMLNAIVNSYVEDEVNMWTSLNENETLSILDKDEAFEHLVFLSDIAFHQAKKCKESKIFLSDENDYRKQLEEMALCLEKIEEYNVDTGKDLLSETILDIDYAFNKSEAMSLRLSELM